MTDKNTRSEQSRINGAKSKGPTSPEGKVRSSWNSIKHGFASAKTTVLSIEDLPAYELHLDGYRKSLNPQCYLEQTLVDELASIKWRQSRLVRIETSLVELQLSMQNEAIEDTYPTLDHDPGFHLALAWQGLARQPQKPAAPEVLPPVGHDITSIELVRRYLTMLDRQYRNVLLNLREYRKDFAIPSEPPTEIHPSGPPPPETNEALNPDGPETSAAATPITIVRKPVTTEFRPVIVRQVTEEAPDRPAASQIKR